MPTRPGPSEDRPSILVVEDELVIAMALETALEDAGYAVVGPASTIPAAVALLAARRPAAALLDVNLDGRSVVPLARRLVAVGVPFALHTAYTADRLTAPVLRAVPMVPKPLQAAALQRVLRELLRVA
jgi:DNA-binding response OmpR family regulator